MSSAVRKLIGVAAVVAAGGVLIGLYVSKLTTDAGSPVYTLPVQTSGGHPVVNLTLETVAAVGPKLSPGHPDFVSYLVRDTKGSWRRSTVWRLPANATVHVTIYNFDGASGLRNPLFARPQGVDGNTMVVDGKSLAVLNPDDASHTFAVAQYGPVVPIAPRPDDAKHPCDFAPRGVCSDHRPVHFPFHPGAT